MSDETIQLDYNTDGDMILKVADKTLSLPENVIVVDKDQLKTILAQNKDMRVFKAQFEVDIQKVAQAVKTFIGDGLSSPMTLVAKLGKVMTNPKKLEKDGIDLTELQEIVNKYLPETTDTADEN